MQDAIAAPKTAESLPVDPRHQKAPKTPTSLSQISKEDIAETLDKEIMEENLQDNEEKDSDIDSDSDEKPCVELGKNVAIKKEPSGQGSAVTAAKATPQKKKRGCRCCVTSPTKNRLRR